MDREEILKKSRESKEDEGATYAENKGRRYGVAAFCSLFAVIMFFNLFTGQSNHVPMSMFWAYMAAEAYGKYRVSKSGALLTTTIFGAIAAAGFFACHVISVLAA